MLFHKLKLTYFGRFRNREIELKPGINLIYGDNEAGKSTIHTFIKGMLFGIERLRGRGSASKEDLYTRYLPWDYPGAFGGSMDIQIGEKELRLIRSFHANDKNFTILDLSTGREVKLKEGLISEMIPGLTEAAFKNTISIEQLKTQTDAELAAQVRNYITNLSIAKSKEVNVVGAVGMLTEKRKFLETALASIDLKALQAEIEEGLKKEETIDQLTLQLHKLLTEEQILKRNMDEFSKALDNETVNRMELLPAVIEKYHSYQELTRQEEALEAQGKKLKENISAWEKEQLASGSLKEDLLEAEKLRSVLLEQERIELELEREKDIQSKAVRRNLSILISNGVISIFILLITRFHPVGIAVSAALLLAGITGYLFYRKNSLKKQCNLEEEIKTARQKTVTAKSKLEEIIQKYRISGIEELTVKQEEIRKNYYALEHAREQNSDLEERRRVLEDNRDILYETIMKYIQYFTPAEELSPGAIQNLQEEIRRRKQEKADRLSDMSRQKDVIKLQIEKLKWEISTLEGNEEQLMKNQELYSQLEQGQRENAIELEAVKLALSTIQELSTDIHDSFGNQLNQAVSKVISEVTGQKYNDLKVDEKLEVKVGWNGNFVLLDRLSAGTIDQVYLALRIAVADLLLGKEEIPLLLDDSFALYDDSRVRAALSMIAQRKQIILFTCHKREQMLLQELGLPYHFVDLSCS